MTNGARNPDPFPAFAFELRITGLAVGGFSECAGLQLETEFQEYSEGGENSFVHKFPTRTKQGNITLKRGIVDRSIWDWYWDLTQGAVAPRNASIVVYDPARKNKIHWDLVRALPCKWVGPDLNATQNSVALETLELCYQRILYRR
ncbi:MAG: phage tail protein [Chloroflexales bacterium]|nr:phage tail protein [Chloroflexales bacterium]